MGNKTQRKIRFTSISIIMLVILSCLGNAQDSLNVRWLGGWTYGEASHLCAGMINGSKYCFLTSGGGVMIINVDDPYSPVKVSQIPGQIYAPRSNYADNFLYIAEKHLSAYNLQDPQHPQLISRLPGLDHIVDVYARDTLAYIIDGNMLRVINYAAPQSPYELGHCYTDQDWCNSIDCQNEYAYITSFSGRIYVIDISNPVNPFLCYDTLRWGNFFDIIAHDDLMLLPGSNGPVALYDITNPAHPIPCGYVEYCGVGHTCAIDDNDHIYRAYKDTTTQLYYFGVYDISDTAAPVRIGSTSIPGYGGEGYVYMDNMLYFSHRSGGLRVFDVTEPGNPVELSYYPTPGESRCVFVEDNYAYFGAEHMLTVVDVSDPHNCLDVGYIMLEDDINNIWVLGDYAYATDDSGGLSIIDIGNPAQPERVGYWLMPSYWGSFGVWVQDSFACVSYHGTDEGLRVINVADPYNPFEAAYLTGVSSQYKIAGGNDRVYLGQYGLNIINVQDPLHPYLENQISEIYGGPVIIASSHVYVQRWDTLYIVNNTDPSSPWLEAAHPYKGADIDDFANYLCMPVYGDFAVRILDVSNPLAPHITGYYKPPAYGSGSSHIYCDGNYIYVCRDNSGLYIYQYYGTGVQEEQSTTLSPVRVSYLSGKVRLSYALSRFSNIDFSIYDVCGRLVQDGKQSRQAGNYYFDLNMRDFSDGIYFIQLQCNEWQVVKKIFVMK